MLLALVSAILFSCVTGTIGCFLLWRNLSFLSDSMAHSTFLGVALGYVVAINPTISSIAVLSVFLILFVVLLRAHTNSRDALLSALAQWFFALGVLILSTAEVATSNFQAMLFGDLLSVTILDLCLLMVIVLVTLVFLYFHFNNLILISFHSDLALAEGIAVKNIELALTCICGVIIVFAIKTIGILLVSALMVLPALYAQVIAVSPKQSVLISTLMSVLMVTTGILLSLVFNFPPSPTIVFCMGSAYMIQKIYLRLAR